MKLDATCGEKAMWNGKDTSNIIFVDLKRDVKPTIIADAKNLPFKDATFSKIYCDPPHLIRNDADSIIKHQPQSVGAEYFMRYGYFKNRTEWLRFLVRVNREFKRCLEPRGILWFKVTDGKDRRVTNLDDVLMVLDYFKEVERHTQDSKLPWSTNKTYFLNFKIR